MLFCLHAEYIILNAWLDESQAEIKTAEEVSTTSNTQMIPF